jgi:NitT/TauT family transport system substrate-binding protein
MKYSILLSLLLILSVSTGCTLTSAVITNEETAISVRFPIPIYEAVEIPFFVAQDRGYYAEEGLAVEFEFGSPEANPIKMVATGVDTIGIMGGPDSIIIAQSKDIPITAFATLHDALSIGFLVLNESPIQTVQDLEGKKVGMFYGHISTDALRTVLTQENVTVEEVDTGFDYSQLIIKDIDAQWVVNTTMGYAFEAKGIPARYIPATDYNVTVQGWTVFTTNEYAKENPEVITKFIQATYKGIAFAKENPELALESLLRRNPSANKNVEEKRLFAYNEQITAPHGKINQTRWQETYDRLLVQGVIEREFELNTTFTDITPLN